MHLSHFLPLIPILSKEHPYLAPYWHRIIPGGHPLCSPGWVDHGYRFFRNSRRLQNRSFQWLVVWCIWSCGSYLSEGRSRTKHNTLLGIIVIASWFLRGPVIKFVCEYLTALFSPNRFIVGNWWFWCTQLTDDVCTSIAVFELRSVNSSGVRRRGVNTLIFSRCVVLLCGAANGPMLWCLRHIVTVVSSMPSPFACSRGARWECCCGYGTCDRIIIKCEDWESDVKFVYVAVVWQEPWK